MARSHFFPPLGSSLTRRYRLSVFHSSAHRIPRTPSPSLHMQFGQWHDITEM